MREHEALIAKARKAAGDTPGYAWDLIRNLADALSAQPAPQPSADIERLERIATRLAQSAKDKRHRAEHYDHMTAMARHELREAADEDEADAICIRSAISSQTSPQGKQWVRTEHARLGSQEATPNTGVKLEGGGG